ncbi:MAG TPA: VOC family protein [Solirubrobacteraceae bacterium]|jgi:catechol 2,3-dioxygenase-like lactoylglutathione lyase family enzyme
MSQTKTPVAKVGRVIVPVSDQDRAIDFYVQNLGFEKIADTPFGNGDRWVEVSLGEGHTALALVPPPPGNPIGVETGIALDVDDVDALHADLRERGVDVDPEVMRMGDPVPPMFFFRDQDGNKLLAVQPSTSAL